MTDKKDVLHALEQAHAKCNEVLDAMAARKGPEHVRRVRLLHGFANLCYIANMPEPLAAEITLELLRSWNMRERKDVDPLLEDVSILNTQSEIKGL